MAAPNSQPTSRGTAASPNTHGPIADGTPSSSGRAHMGNGSGPVSPSTPKPVGANKKNPLK
jgi:hypothetical protein